MSYNQNTDWRNEPNSSDEDHSEATFQRATIVDRSAWCGSWRVHDSHTDEVGYCRGAY